MRGRICSVFVGFKCYLNVSFVGRCVSEELVGVAFGEVRRGGLLTVPTTR